MKRRERLSVKDRRLLKETLKELNRQGRLQEEKLAKQHGSTSVYQHSINVAYLSLWLAGRLPLRTDRRALVRGALLHDYFLYDWHKKDDGHRWHGFRHGKTAARNAKQDYRLNRLEEYIIARHMFPLTVLPPKSKEGWMVCLADKWCAAEETVRRFSDFSKAEGSLINKRRGSIKKRDLRESKTSFFYFCKRKSPCKRKGKKRMTGIEPASKAWEAFILPMNYIRTDLFVTKSLYSELLLM